ncbi:CPBP family intramembrane glutamic endopeptidase [Staphylococcus edaphicus]|uniref:CPBP family glutamic-type intramembrane protease n=1 Tax=Staphylococcus edaphicus TaxID=1955013 RepID=A0A2C6WMH5_9STAP|nr:CPBP family intramembrane glutamic endopeptidase [Staphylococcus edaphicus]PHK50300.1 lysostaphin resistance protein A [Staphylococcus edaphicus]UQW82103.1 CPBP family glutamic-type intramembrane protease [Staphylococcus edaphicus]
MNTKRIPGFQWAMMIFIFFIIAYALPIILKDLQGSVPFKGFVFDMSTLAPFIAAFICIVVFQHRGIQLASLKFTISLKVIERAILALILPLVIFIIAMASFNIFSDSFVLLQSKDLSVSIFSIIIGQVVMAFLVELGFRSYLQHIVETKMNTFFASIIVGFMYAIWNVNIAFSFDFAIYSFLYSFAFSMIVGELIRATKGRTIYIATLFHAAMSFGLVFLFNEELGEIFAMKVIALSTVAVAVLYILISLIIRTILYFFTKRNLDEVEENNYLDHVNETDEETKDSLDDNGTHQQTNKTEDSSDFASTSAADSSQTNDTQQSFENDNSVPDTQKQTEPHKSLQDAEHDHSNKDSSSSNIIQENTPSASLNKSELSSDDSIKDHASHSNTSANSAVEASTEKAHPESSQDELKTNARYASNRKSSVVSDASTMTDNDNDDASTHPNSQHHPSDQQDNEVEDTETSTQTEHERSPFDLKSKRGHRR